MSEIRVDTISEKTSANGVAIDGLTIKDGGITATTGVIVFNEASADVDFRVESDDNVNMLFVDGGNDRVGVGTGTPSSALEIVGASSVPQLTVRSNNATAANNAGLILYNTDSATAASRKVELLLDADGANGSGTDYLLIKKTGNNGDAEIRNANNANLIFSTNNAEKWRIDNTGNLVPGATSLGIYLGVSSATAANLLDDYEEGTWTIVLEDHSDNAITLSTNAGTYIKIGGQVTITGYLIATALESASGPIRISGLPFNILGNARNYAAMTIGYAAGLNITAGTSIAGIGIVNTANVNIVNFDVAAGSTNLTAAKFSADGQFIFTMTYTVV